MICEILKNTSIDWYTMYDLEATKLRVSTLDWYTDYIICNRELMSTYGGQEQQKYYVLERTLYQHFDVVLDEITEGNLPMNTKREMMRSLVEDALAHRFGTACGIPCTAVIDSNRTVDTITKWFEFSDKSWQGIAQGWKQISNNIESKTLSAMRKAECQMKISKLIDKIEEMSKHKGIKTTLRKMDEVYEELVDAEVGGLFEDETNVKRLNTAREVILSIFDRVQENDYRVEGDAVYIEFTQDISEMFA
jgi:hypothetical protein